MAGPGRARKLVRLAAWASLATLIGSPAWGAGPTLVSINLCTDQLAVAIADPEQILGLSRYARDRLRSPVAEAAWRLPSVSGTAEEVLARRPDLVLAGRFTKRATRDLLRAKGFRVVELDAVRSIDEAKAQLRRAGELLGHPDRADAAVARIDAALARARAASAGTPLSVLPLQRRGWVSGRETVMTSLLDAVGLANAGAALSRGLGRQATLESVIALRPDLLLLSEGAGRAEDQGSALLLHPALLRLYPPERRLLMPEDLGISCGGPTLVEAIERLASEMARRRR